MKKRSYTRRTFLANTSAGSAVVAATALSVRRVQGANERISIGMIGNGSRASEHLTDIIKLSKQYNVEITAVCDVWQPNLERAAGIVAKAYGQTPYKCTKFGELLALKNVDAVVIATPDFLHTPIMIEALKADKDVYVEKPMSLEIENANKALDLAREHDRVVQVGTQYRSSGSYRAASRVLATGVLGHISRISASANFNQARWARRYDDCKEEDVDWDAYLLNRPKRPFDPKLLRRWQHYKECTNGLSGLWMSHYVDAVHLLTGAKYPRSAVALGNIYVWKDTREHCDTFRTIFDYPEGFLFDWGMGLANSAGVFFHVYGTCGMLDLGDNYVSPNKLELSGKGGAGENQIEETRSIKPDKGYSHMGNWLECVRNHKRPIADIQYGHQHAVATIMSAQALHTGRRVIYDQEKRQILPG